MKNVKSYLFVKEYFSNTDILVVYANLNLGHMAH